jgi:hypothetical protein
MRKEEPQDWGILANSHLPWIIFPINMSLRTSRRNRRRIFSRKKGGRLLSARQIAGGASFQIERDRKSPAQLLPGGSVSLIIAKNTPAN